QTGLVDLGALTGTNSLAHAVNDNGVVVGDWFGATEGGAFAWTAQGGMVDLGSGAAGAQAVSDRGQVVGLRNAAHHTQFHPFSWTRRGGIVDLGTLGGTLSDAYAVNGNGQVVGDSQTGAGSDTHAFSWTAKTGMVDLGTLGGSSSHAENLGAVNLSGQVVGSS